MKFGDTLAKHKLGGWKYIDYEGLKKLIKESTSGKDDDAKGSNWSSVFLCQLMDQIGDVNSFFLGMEAMLKKRTASYDKATDINGKMAQQLSKMMTNLCKYVVLNYIAVLKICKKHDKHSTTTLVGEVKQTLFTTDFFLSLSNSDLFRNVNEMVKSITKSEGENSEVGKSCPICNESMNVGNTSLPCGHCICWTCLAEATWKSHRQCPLCRKEQVVEPVNLEITTILGSLSQHYFPFNIDGDAEDEMSEEEEEEEDSKKIPSVKTTTTTTVKIKKEYATIKSDNNINVEALSSSNQVVDASLLTTMAKTTPTTTARARPKKRRQNRKRPFGSIRCSKCNKFGLESECCGAKYHVVIRVRRVPQPVRSALLKKAFNTYDEADAARLKIENMYPKVFTSRKGRRKKQKLEKKEESMMPLIKNSPSLTTMVSTAMPSPLLMGQSPRISQGSFDDIAAKVGGGIHNRSMMYDIRKRSSSAISMGSIDSSTSSSKLMLDHPTGGDSAFTMMDKNLHCDEGDNDLVSDLYNQVMLAEARAHAAVEQANLNQQRCRTLEMKLLQTQRTLNNIVTKINTPRSSSSSSQQEQNQQQQGPPRLRTQSKDWHFSPQTSPSKTNRNTTNKLPELANDLFASLDDLDDLSELGVFL